MSCDSWYRFNVRERAVEIGTEFDSERASHRENQKTHEIQK